MLLSGCILKPHKSVFLIINWLYKGVVESGHSRYNNGSSSLVTGVLYRFNNRIEGSSNLGLLNHSNNVSVLGQSRLHINVIINSPSWDIHLSSGSRLGVLHWEGDGVSLIHSSGCSNIMRLRLNGSGKMSCLTEDSLSDRGGDFLSDDFWLGNDSFGENLGLGGDSLSDDSWFKFDRFDLALEFGLLGVFQPLVGHSVLVASYGVDFIGADEAQGRE